MAATRRQAPLHIFQDPDPALDHHEVAAYDAQILDALTSVTDVSSAHHTLLEPPQTFAHAPSPKKTRHASSSPPPSALIEKGLNRVLLPPPQEQAFNTDAPRKKMPRPVSQPTQATPGRRALFTSFPSQFDQENVYTVPVATLQGIPAAEPPTKPGNKRALMDAAPLRDRHKKQKVREVRVEEDGPLPEPDEMPPVEDDDGMVKPPFSYAILIGMAILRAPNRRLTLAQIYKWISDTFAFYRNSQETGWQNSIRHNLSLSKSFSKQERPKDDPGKGHYWRINPGFEKQYCKVKTTRRPANSDSFVAAYPSEAPRPRTSTATSLPPLSSSKAFDSSKFPEEPELSSDATIPCSDPAAHDGHNPDRAMAPPDQIPSSPPPAAIHSSPPPPVSRSLREDTPPRAPRFPTNSRSGGRKRKFNGLGDSGYYSSIESSAIKGNPLGILTSEADVDRPTLKRGRAEEEIARIRSSSYDSPSKTRPYMKNLSATQLMSSPFRTGDKRDGPLTPAFVFKRPALPPASASPNTNLQNHRQRMRELVGGSPDKSLPMWVDTSFLDRGTWSPAVQVPNEEKVNLIGEGFDNTFDIFADYDYQESPLKRNAKRPRLERAVTSTGILADITGSTPNITNSPTPNWRLSSSFLNIPSLSPTRCQSPAKASIAKAPTSNACPRPGLDKTMSRAILIPPQAFAVPKEPQAADDDDDIFHLLHSDESEPGIDMLQGFEKIGAPRASVVASNGSPKVSRPGLMRSSSNRF
ncbi:forkhead transcription factor-like protein [Massariosphaeria phaeospora]|uniref:Forkhead transcription factor-like protein n=1 Tax=Massariosphaeria phaeospora TaxID=100035 RepID=A0A7C8M0V2_9PLEO|nr:forkhead transcription factor-like protein [Massariosphaeria phaeospora]